MSGFLIFLSVLSIIISFFAAGNVQTETAFQQLVSQNYLTHGLLFSLFFIGLAFCNWKLREESKKRPVEQPPVEKDDKPPTENFEPSIKKNW
ncbi:MAG: hypothetical protein HZB36_02485 [Candidatus Omnitrophica bacterium]|nr:hypothetical protein [Candidatus Omnitrophota bacterium]